MRTFIEWLIHETAASPINWIEKNETGNHTGWMGRFSIGNIEFQLDIWSYWGNKSYQVAFYQTKEIFGGKNINTTYSEPVGLNELIQLFQSIDDGLIEFLSEHPHVEELRIHPEAVGQRDTVAKTRRIKTSSTFSPNFDPNKFNAYQLLFQHSKLRSMGFNMKSEDESLVIYRPTTTSAPVKSEPAPINISGRVII